MSSTLVFFVCIVAIFAFFLEEWMGLAQKLWRISGFTLFLPLLIFSSLAELCIDEAYWLLLHVQGVFYDTAQIIGTIFSISASVIRELLVFLVAILPLWWQWYRNRADLIFHISSTRLWVVMLLWITLTIILLF